MKTAKVTVVALGAVVLTATAAKRPMEFTYEPQPRWQVEPVTEEVCRAIAAGCPGRVKDGAVQASWNYAEIYNADGYMIGLRSLKSTGCRPLDEHMMLTHRAFRQAFSKSDEPDLKGISVETDFPASRDSVRIVKTDDTQISIGCN
jgi:hypothetical protein